ncbi:hypothetical protein [Jannaschia sp. LMIT008]|uniref:hypothetical protein n=1 Tax=Jannaschia maritima TaxID=3032585 RepID=UPI0028126F64|nr:hypothetical protein [Jannaschia sp. LMIT008]
MTTEQKHSIDDSPPLPDDFFENAVPCTEEAAIVAVARQDLSDEERRYRAVMAYLVRAHDDGVPLAEALSIARTDIAAE